MSQSPGSLVSSQGFEYGVKHFYNQRSGLITEILFDTLTLPVSEALALLNLGAIYINNQRQTSDRQIEASSLFRVHCKPRRYSCNENWKSLIVFEDQDFIILNKPSGIPSHPSVDNRIENSLTQLSLAINSPLLITHRLDTLTAGLIVYAKTPQFVKSFNTQLQERGIEKKYVALLETSKPVPEKVIHYMEPSPRAPKKVSASFVDLWLFCELEILEQKKMGDVTWVKINLLTGRTHQIRAQMAELQAPIRGDKLYGSQMPYKENSIALRSCELEFNWTGRRHQFRISEEFDPV